MEVIRVPLNGEWQLCRTGDTHPPTPAGVPGSVQEALLASGQLEDPFVGTNEERVQWVGREEWTFRRRFRAPPLPAPAARAYLVFEGLDTFARVLLNGLPVGSSDNMFMPWRFDVTDALAEGENELTVIFESTEARADRLAEQYGVRLPNVSQAPGAPTVRKAPSHWGWDWGPKILAVGLWRPVRLEIVPRAYIGALDAWGEPKDDGTATLGASVEADGPDLAGVELEVSATSPGGRPVGQVVRAPLREGRARVEIPVAKPELWWPSGLGGQPLYTLQVRLVADGRTVDSQEVRVGIRRLEVVRETDADGQSFYFRVNGRPLFAKGANWIPADSLPARISPERYRRLLADCRAAGMNMLRVWGGGLYEAPAFYDACDELGILIWQDFMYACAMYPGDDPAFLENARAEARWAVRRLRRHTSLALWCGNNEMEMGWFHWGWEKNFDPRLWPAYQRLFHEMLPATCAEHDPRRLYVPSSPHGLQVEEANDTSSGDVHIWTVWHGSLDPRGYLKIVPRFVSEYGFQSLPAMETLRAVVPADQMAMDSPAMLQHQKCGGGNEKILQAVAEWFGPHKDFDALVYLSQVLQARAVAVGTEHFRRSAPRTMGALYWQANDCWPVASWASLDYFGRWKALHYAARRFFAPLLVSGLADEETVRLWCTADAPPAGPAEPLEANLLWSVWTYAGRRLAQGETTVVLQPGRTTDPLVLRWADAGAEPGTAFVAADLVRGGERLGRAVVHPPSIAAAALARPALQVSAGEADGAAVEIAAGAGAPALAVWLEAEGLPGRFDDNFFDLLPGERRSVRFLADEPVALKTLAGRLRVRTLADARP